MSEGLRSPDGLYAHKAALDREHPFNPVAVAFLSKPSALSGATCGNHYDPNYGFLTSTAPSCYHHEFDYGYSTICAPPPHTLLTAAANQMRGHMQAPLNNLGKPPNEADEDAYLEQNPEERENYADKKENLDNLTSSKNLVGCVQCGQQIRQAGNLQQPTLLPNNLPLNNNQCCGCDCTNLANKDNKIDSTLTRAILEQYVAGVGNGSLASDSLNSTVGLRDVN